MTCLNWRQPWSNLLYWALVRLAFVLVARWRAAVPDYPAGAVLGFLMPVILYSATAILKPALIVPPLIRCAFSAVASSKYTAYRLVSVTPSRGFRPCPGFLFFLGIRAVSSFVIVKYGPIFNKCQQSSTVSFQKGETHQKPHENQAESRRQKRTGRGIHAGYPRDLE